MAKPSFYQDGSNYVLATGEYPPGFKNTLHVVWAGELDSLQEAVYSTDQLKALKKVKMVPDKWLEAFEEASGIEIKKPEPKRREAVFDDVADTEEERYEEFGLHCAAETDIETAMMVSSFGLVEDEPEPKPKPKPEPKPQPYRRPFITEFEVYFVIGVAIMLFLYGGC